MINPYINYPLDNSRKVAPVATSVAPVVAGHCTPTFVLIEFHIWSNITAYTQFTTVLVMYHSFFIYHWLLCSHLLKIQSTLPEIFLLKAWDNYRVYTIYQLNVHSLHRDVGTTARRHCIITSNDWFLYLLPYRVPWLHYITLWSGQCPHNLTPYL